jgi:hypothetical protein
MDIHGYSDLVLWPWGFTSTVAPNGTAMQTLGRKFAYFNNYTPEQSVGLYPTDGTTDDFAYGDLGVAAFTIELGSAFFESCSSFENTVLPANMPALLLAAKMARTPYLTPAGPDALNVAASPVTATLGSPATLTATINDTRYNNSNGTEATQNIAAAEYYIDVPPWDTAHTPVAIPMTAVDGSFNSKTENVTATVNTGSLAAGRHIVFVRGQDAAGNWGAFSAAFLDVTPCAALAAPAGLTIDRGGGDQVHLAWDAAAGAAYYEVWYAANQPYFTPGADCDNPAPYGCAYVAGSSFTHASLGDPAQNYSYVVRSGNSCGAVSPVSSVRVGEFDYPVVPGN